MTAGYQRSQLELAIWRALTARPTAPPVVFKNRIKRLLDLDRADAEQSKPVFVQGAGSGKNSEYSGADTFCLSVGVCLLDVGFKQSEVLAVLGHIRDVLDAWFPKLISRLSVIDRQVSLASMHPELPSFRRGGRDVADARVFLVLDRVETNQDEAKAAIAVPEVIEGAQALSVRLDDLMPNRRRTAIVIEVASLAQAVTEFLEAAPALSRGRSS